MKPEDHEAFDNALVNRCQTVVTVPQDFEAGWQAALAHRDAQPAVACSFPERDVTKPAEEQGLFRKFDVRRVDGSDAPGGKHHGCEYFVLDLNHDTHAPAALRAYAQACNKTHPQLSTELSERLGPQPAVAVPVGCAVSQISSRMCERGTKGCVVEHESPAVAQPPADVVNEPWYSLLCNLVEGINRTHWSSWQTTAYFQQQLSEAEAAIAAAEQQGKGE